MAATVINVILNKAEEGCCHALGFLCGSCNLQRNVKLKDKKYIHRESQSVSLIVTAAHKWPLKVVVGSLTHQENGKHTCRKPRITQQFSTAVVHRELSTETFFFVCIACLSFQYWVFHLTSTKKQIVAPTTTVQNYCEVKGFGCCELND